MTGRNVVPLTPRPTVTCFRCGARANPGQCDGDVCPAGGCGGRLYTPSVVDWGPADTVDVGGKRGPLIGAIVDHPGPVVVTSDKRSAWEATDDRRIGARALAELSEAERAMDEIDGGMGRVDPYEHPERIGEPLAERIRRWAGAQR